MTVAGSVANGLSVFIRMILIGLGVGFGGCFFYTKGLQNIETGVANILCSLKLVTATLLGIEFFKEILTASVLIRLVLIILGIVVTNVRFSAKHK